MKKIYLLLIIAILIGGCQRVKPSTIYTPNFNDVVVAELGDNLFTKTYAYFPHKKYVKLVKEEDNLKYNIRDIGQPFDKLGDTECALYKGINSLLDYNCDGYFTHTRYGNKLEKPVKYKVFKAPISTAKLDRNSFMREVLYQGKIENKLKITFREFFRSLKGAFIIRDSFTQTIQYELDSKGEAMIGFKGLRIKVLKATNSEITYKVLKDFDE